MGDASKNGRDVRLDALRGLFLIVMTIDHLPGAFMNFTYGSLGFITAAEGFVFLSGLVAGRVYQRYDLQGDCSLWRHAFRRAWRIYSCHALIFILLFALPVVFGLKTFLLETFIPLFFEKPLLSLPMGLTLTYQPKLLDILPMYCLFILTVPLLVAGSKSKRWVLMLSITGLLWVAAQFGVREYLETGLSRYAPVDLGFFNVLAWQLIFILGVMVGLRKPGLAAAKSPMKSPVFIGCLLVAGLLFLIRHHFILDERLIFWIEDLARIDNLGPIRLLNFLAVAYVVGNVLIWPTDNIWNNGLAYLGRHSLQVFTYHIFLVYLLYGWLLRSPFNELWVILCVATLFLPAWIFENRKISNGIVVRPSKPE